MRCCFAARWAGANITSAWPGGGALQNASRTLSGTNTGPAAVAGVLALLLEANGTASPADLRLQVYDLATKGA